MDFYKGVFLGPVLVGKGDNSFFLKMRLSRFCKWAPQVLDAFLLVFFLTKVSYVLSFFFF